MGGENRQGVRRRRHQEGSSPRGRGKRCPPSRYQATRGLIPAWAGKTLTATTSTSCRRAHPRVGGENWFHARVSQALRGSSPRGRGKPSVRLRKCTPRGLIPAWAGKTRLGTLTTSRSRAHPRVGGENAHGHGRRHRRRGSSPRGRGKPHGARLAPGVSGLIPAWAGKTCKSNPYVLGVRAHPRVGGENLEGVVYVRQTLGSSPRGRGKLVILPFLIVSHRLIPAWAGKTMRSPARPRSSPAHPRVGGENLSVWQMRSTLSGSSPRGRGKLLLCRCYTRAFRLIPAWAGKTQKPECLPA